MDNQRRVIIELQSSSDYNSHVVDDGERRRGISSRCASKPALGEGVNDTVVGQQSRRPSGTPEIDLHSEPRDEVVLGGNQRLIPTEARPGHVRERRTP